MTTPDFWTKLQQELDEHGLVLTRQQVKNLGYAFLFGRVLPARETFVINEEGKKL